MSEFPSIRKFWCTSGGIRERRPPGKKYGQPLEAQSGHWLTASKEMGASVLQPQWTAFYQQPQWACKWIVLPASPDKNSVQVTPSTFRPFWNSEQRSQQLCAWTCDPQDWELRKGHSKLLSLWPFVMQNQKTNTRGKEMESHRLCLKFTQEAPRREECGRGREGKMERAFWPHRSQHG